jgi:hypothetical protein
MAYEDEYGFGDGSEGAISQTNYGLASNPLMPLGDPMAYARMMQSPTGDRPVGGDYAVPVENTVNPAVQSQGMPVAPIRSPAPLNVPPPVHRGGGTPEQPQNDLQPQGQGPDQGQLGSLGQLLQMKGLSDLASPTPGGAVAAPGAGAGPGRAPAGAVIEKAAAPYKDMVVDAAKQNGVNPDLYKRLLYQESGFSPKATSPAGARGIAQFMPATARDEGVDVTDPKSSIYGGARYLGKMIKQFGGNEQLGVAAYNTGPVNVQKWLDGKFNLLPETQNYVNTITGKPITKPSGNVPSAMATPQAATTTAKGGGFVVPPAAAAKGTGEMSPAGGPYVIVGGKKYATDGSGNIINPNSKMKYPDKFDPNNTEDSPKSEGAMVKVPGSEKTLPVTGGVGNDQGTPNLGGGVSQPAIDPNKIVPGATPSPEVPAAPAAGNAPAATPGQSTSGFMNDEAMKKLWQYMLIKSLFPQIQFRNVGYDPWAVHRLGQSGGY